ncbi:MAG: diguanylate cyclase, partial [Christensenellaceae bacterium]|nr:diguanylate cyclase [Christensenellaceae bacterium]
DRAIINIAETMKKHFRESDIISRIGGDEFLIYLSGAAENSESIAISIERKVSNDVRNEVPVKEIGEMVMDALKETDEVAYVRFASVYREFKDVDTFMAELKQLIKR